jgi:hypothetical protein
MVAEAMTEAALGEDTRGELLVSQVARNVCWYGRRTR